MEFVLDDQVGGTDRANVLELGRRQPAVGAMVAGAVRFRPEKTVAGTFRRRASEQGAGFSPPCHHRELVDGGDHHGRRTMINLLVDHEHRKAGMELLA